MEKTGITKNGEEVEVPAELRADTMAYALQCGAYNIASNVFQPYINYQVQKHSSNAVQTHQYGSYMQNLEGEIAGDIIGAATLMAAEAAMPNQLHHFTKAARHAVDPIYEKLAPLAVKHDCPQDEYRKKVDDWKTFQERNLVRSGIVAAAGIAGNVITQKNLFNNPSPAGLIFKGKLASEALSTALGLGVRFTIPEQSQKLDDWISKRFEPMLKDTTNGKKAPASHAERVEQSRQGQESALAY